MTPYEAERTLAIHMQELRALIASDLRRAIYNELKNEHPGDCPFYESPENHCDCALSTMVDIAAGRRVVAPAPTKLGAWE